MGCGAVAGSAAPRGPANLAPKKLQPGEPFAEDPADEPAVCGFLHKAASGKGDGLVLTHGAGGNCRSSLLVSVGELFSAAGVTVLRCDLPFRQKRPKGPPHPSGGAKDRAGLRAAVAALRRIVPGRVFLGGQSYGARQATMLLAEDREAADGLVLISYPLHPPGAPEKLRTDHFPRLQVPALFLHGTRDPFGNPEEMTAALKLIPAQPRLCLIDGGGHGLSTGRGAAKVAEVVEVVLGEFQSFFAAA